MAIAHLTLVIATIFSNFEDIAANNNTNRNPILDPKRRNDVVEETFLEQKGVLLDMLESKLKEVRDKKKKRTEPPLRSNFLDLSKCDTIKDIVLKLKASGISAVGEADIHLKFGNIGKGSLNFDATGISNVGKAHLNLGVEDGAVNIPGLENLFTEHKMETLSMVESPLTNTFNNTSEENRRAMPAESKSNYNSTTTVVNGLEANINSATVSIGVQTVSLVNNSVFTSVTISSTNVK
ncbi:hypothetical protein K1T71_007391 [Dendrolimus kikuchii]|uniref:Uncharacterized protein n=1 Tax=Dendrolimus kikuchii TaxID=765133 RepID=A0ACC1D1X5_9NEOP|nr:hypothetical protein K1T71_007391 [Dendrolimus kikuchii]